MIQKLIKTNEEWKKILTQKQYHILREKGTELPGTGKWLNNKKTGKYQLNSRILQTQNSRLN